MSKFRLLDYTWQAETGVAKFRYQGKDGLVFTETVQFEKGTLADDRELDQALYLAWVLIGTSYYKAAPTKEVELPRPLAPGQAEFFNLVYQEGLGQFAFENELTRADLAHFEAENWHSGGESANGATPEAGPPKTLVLVSGGKDSLLLAREIQQSGEVYQTAYITTSGGYPEIIDDFGWPLLIRRQIDRGQLKKAGGLNGHVPITLINQALALVQALLLGYNRVELGIGHEGFEAHAEIGDLKVNHQWSKTTEAQAALRRYVRDLVTRKVAFGDRLAALDELEIARRFADLCWEQFGQKFSSCNQANYRLANDNSSLKWCGKCAKCANSYLLFAPFVDFEQQKQLFGRDLFLDPEMTEIFKGLLGIDGVMKPFECVASVAELRWAYRNRRAGYGELPFAVPD